MATTNISQTDVDPEAENEAEKNFRDMMTKETTIGDSSRKSVAATDKKELDNQDQPTTPKGEETKVVGAKADESPNQGANLVIEDNHRNTAIEIFESFFARAYKRKDNTPMTYKRFMRSIDRLKKREGFEDAYTDQFRKLFDDAVKDDQDRMSSESLIDAIVVMVEKQDQEMKDDESENSVPK